MQLKRLILALVVLATVLALAGCGATQPAPGATQGGAQPGKESAKATAAKKLDFAFFPSPETVQGQTLKWMSEEITKQSNGELEMVFHPGTLFSTDQEIVDAVKTGNVAVGHTGGVTATVIPEMGLFQVPFLVRDYDHAYKVFNGPVGKELSDLILSKYQMNVLMYFDFGYRHFFNTRRPINSPEDMKGLKIRVIQSKVVSDTINALGASAIPMPWGEVISSVQQGVIDGGDLPVVNMDAVKIYDVAKYASLSFHTYAPDAVLFNPKAWDGLTPGQRTLITNLAMQAQKRMVDQTASVDSLEGAKKLLEPRGMKINAVDAAAFRKIAEEKVWPQYQKQYGQLWDKVVAVK